MTDEPSNAKVHLDMLRIIANQRQSDKLFHLLDSVGEFKRPSKANGDKKKTGKSQIEGNINWNVTYSFLFFKHSDTTTDVPAPFTAEAAFSET